MDFFNDLVMAIQQNVADNLESCVTDLINACNKLKEVLKIDIL